MPAAQNHAFARFCRYHCVGIASVRDIEILTISAAAQQKNMEQKEHQMMEMMQDSTMRSMMMDHMAENPEMRKQMMQRMMRSGEMNHSVMMENMQNMMNNPEMKVLQESLWVEV
jgi:hypothetical protein